jgi:hypothetical protein
MSSFVEPPGRDALLSGMPDVERERLGEALRRLLSHGSILGQEGGQEDLYSWCSLNRERVEEFARLLELKVFWDDEIRLVQAVPQTGGFILRLKLDASLILLTLWYEFDTAVRDRGESPPIRLSVEQLNDSLRTKFEPLRKNLPSPTRLREVLSVAQRKNLVRFTPSEKPADAVIEILPTLKRVIPFQAIEDWTRMAERYVGVGEDEETEEESS